MSWGRCNGEVATPDTTCTLDVNEDGYFDVYLGGHEFDSYGAMETIILLGNKENKFSTSRKLRIPSIKNNGVPLDILKYKDYLFILRTGSKPNFYKGSLIQQVDLKNMETVSVIENKNIDHWLDRLFEIKVDIGPPKFGSFSYKNRGIEFVFEDNKMRLTSN